LPNIKSEQERAFAGFIAPFTRSWSAPAREPPLRRVPNGDRRRRGPDCIPESAVRLQGSVERGDLLLVRGDIERLPQFALASSKLSILARRCSVFIRFSV
jgi:hypothetical protein